MRETDDFVRGADNVGAELARLHDGKADVSQKSSDAHLKSFAHLAWRPAWSIRSRRGALRPLIKSLRRWLARKKG
jgi:hypothetical protein